MGLFNKNRRKVVDLTERYNREKERIESIKETIHNSKPIENSAPTAPGIFGMFGGGTPSVNINSEEDSNSEEKRKLLGKRLKDMTEKIEEQSNQIYQLQQKVEFLERKSRVDY